MERVTRYDPGDAVINATLEPYLGRWITESDVNNAPGQDIYISAQSQGWVESSQESRDIRLFLYNAVKIRHKIMFGDEEDPNQMVPPALFSTVARHGLMRYIVPREGRLRFFEEFCRPSRWKEVQDLLVNGDSLESDMFVNDIYHNFSAKCNDQRYISVLIMFTLFEDILGLSDPRIFDGGSSIMNGAKKLAMQNYSPFKSVNVVRRLADGQEVLDPMMTHKLNQYYSFTPSHILCLDLFKPDKGRKEWAEVCRFYPGQREDKVELDHYHLLDAMDFDTLVQFMEGDLADPDTASQIKKVYSKPFDISILSTVLNQMGAHHRQIAIQTAREITDKLIIVQELAHSDPSHPDQVVLDDWTPWAYRTMVIDPLDPTGELVEILRWSNASCRKLEVMSENVARFKAARKARLAKAV